jgi:hypothetical protein
MAVSSPDGFLLQMEVASGNLCEIQRFPSLPVRLGVCNSFVFVTLIGKCFVSATLTFTIFGNCFISATLRPVMGEGRGVID